MSDDIKTDSVVWLRNKYARHKEIEDNDAADEIENLREQLAEKDREIKQLKNILRCGHNELEIRMSHNDNHCLRIIADQELRSIEWPIERIQKEAGYLYMKLKDYEKSKP